MQDISLKTEPRRYTKSSSFVMALLFTILCGAAALILGYFINYFARGHFVHSTDAVLNAEIRYIEVAGIPQENDPEQLYILLDHTNDLPHKNYSNLSRLAEGILVFTDANSHRRYAAKIHTMNDGSKILVGTDITEISKDFKFMQWLGIASIAFVMIVVFFSYIISVFVVSGTNKIAGIARDIMHTGDLSRRVEIESQWDDLSNMAAVLNMLLDRVEELMQGVRQVSDNIAHDLRTPLTRIRGSIDGLQDGEKKKSLLKETDQLLNTFNALLRISRIETEKQRSQFTQTPLKPLLEDIIAFYEPLAEEKNIAIESDLDGLSILGDRDLLFQAFANLLDNALKFTPDKGSVSIRLYNQNNKTYIEFQDTGAGIDDKDKKKIFDRFYRGEESRKSSGTGLGLSLVLAVINLHEGTIDIKSTHPGLQIITIL